MPDSQPGPPPDGFERTRFDAALAHLGVSSDPFAAAVWATRMPIVITDPRAAGNPIVFVNDAFCTLTGYARAESIGRNCRFLQGAGTDPGKIALLRAAVAAATPLDVELRNYRKDGTPFWNRLHMVPLHDASGTLIYFIASQLDATVEHNRLPALERHNAALLAEKAARQQADLENAEKSRFLAVASHDIRQPLQSLMLLQGVLAGMVLGQAAEQLVLRLGQTLDSMSGMLNSLLDLDQIEAGVVRTDMSDFNIKDILLRLRDGFAYDAQAKGLTLHVVACNVIVRSDARLLEQMIRNLLANAIKYTRHGKVLLGCRRRAGGLSIEIWDTGIGIPPDAIGAIFREYHQLDNANRRSGRGLGLSIVHRFGALLHHSVRVASVPGHGSMFAIDLVLPATALARTIGLDGASVFIVDDDPEVSAAIGGVIEAAGGVPRSYTTSEAFRLAGRPPGAACLLVDAYLPGMSGLALIRALRAEGDTLPAIMITGDSDVAMAVAAMKAGASDFIEKPVGAAALLASVSDALGESRGAETLAVRRRQAAAQVEALTARQREIMVLVLAGHPSKNIAADLGISQRTVENHRASIMRKTNTKSLPALARLALAAAWDGQDAGRERDPIA